MAIDRVDDMVDPLSVRHWEIEIEASSDEHSTDIAEAGRDLLSLIGGRLRPFSGSKLGIGLALRELKPRLRDKRLVDGRGRLTSDGLDAVERVLRRGTVTAA
jgi:hypothetical protein